METLEKKFLKKIFRQPIKNKRDERRKLFKYFLFFSVEDRKIIDVH